MRRRENGQKVDADDTIPGILWLERTDKLATSCGQLCFLLVTAVNKNNGIVYPCIQVSIVRLHLLPYNSSIMLH